MKNLKSVIVLALGILFLGACGQQAAPVPVAAAPAPVTTPVTNPQQQQIAGIGIGGQYNQQFYQGQNYNVPGPRQQQYGNIAGNYGNPYYDDFGDVDGFYFGVGFGGGFGGGGGYGGRYGNYGGCGGYGC